MGENGYRKKQLGMNFAAVKYFTPMQWSIEKAAAKVGLLSVHRAAIFWSAENLKLTFNVIQQFGNDSSGLQELFGRSGEYNLYNQ